MGNRDRNILDARTAFERDIRVYVQSKLSEESRKQLEALQGELRSHVGESARMTRHLHLTVLHLGKPRQLLEHMRKHNPDISTETFSRALDAFIEQTHDVLGHPYSLDVRGLEFFGSRRDVLALRLEANNAYRCARETAADNVHAFLRQCGVTDTYEYVRSDSQLRHTEEITPHVTLARNVAAADIPELETVPDHLGFRPSAVLDPTGDN